MSHQSKLPRLLFCVTEVWELSKSPLHVTSDISESPGYRSGDELELRRPDGSQLRVKSGLVHLNRDWKVVLSEPEREWPLVFWLENLTKEDVPVGTEAWMLVEHPTGKLPRGWERVEKQTQRRHSA